jgi:type I restriction enzyme, S subunit
VKLETFFEKFDLFADAPDAVAKMRELVLDLAVKGKLTDRDLKNELIVAKYSNEPCSDALPANWRLLNFGKFCDIQGGNQPPKSQFSDQPRPGYVRMFQIRDLGDRPVPVYISKESTNRFCREGEILIGRYGASVGKIFWAQDGAYNVALAKFMFPEEAFHPAFAFWVLKSDFFQATIAGASRSAQAGFNKGDLAAIDFPLPPLAEQRRIVAKVDELMALCDRLEAQQQERETQHTALARASLASFAEAPTPANLQYLFHPSYTITPADLRKSILTLAVQGKLVPQDPNDETSASLVQLLIAKQSVLFRKEGLKARKAVVVPDRTTFANGFPQAWSILCFDEVAVIVSGVTKGRKLAGRETVTLPYLRVANVKRGHLDLDVVKDIEVLREELGRYRLVNGDVLMTEGGDWDKVGRAAIWREEIPDCIHQNHVYRVRSAAPEMLLPQWIVLFANSPLGRRYFEGAAKQTTNLASINMTQLRSCPLPIPPTGEQRRIIAKVDLLMALVDKLETQLAASRATATNLLSAIVGELTTSS